VPARVEVLKGRGFSRAIQIPWIERRPQRCIARRTSEKDSAGNGSGRARLFSVPLRKEKMRASPLRDAIQESRHARPRNRERAAFQAKLFLNRSA
jgi:hypothetical protein